MESNGAGSPGSGTGINERRFRTVWEDREIAGRSFTAEGGEIITVIYPGRPNDGRGADFRDAVLLSNERLITGDVEFHLRSGDWRGHGHHLILTITAWFFM